MVISYAADDVVYALNPSGEVTLAETRSRCQLVREEDISARQRLALEPRFPFPSRCQFCFARRNHRSFPSGRIFLSGATSWGVKSSPQIRSFGLGLAVPGEPFYVTDESELRTWVADVNPDGSLKNFRLFAEQGGESVTVDSRGNVYIAAGQVYVYDPAGKLIDTIEVPERPIQLMFGGADRKTLFIAARTSLYSVRMKYSGR